MEDNEAELRTVLLMFLPQVLLNEERDLVEEHRNEHSQLGMLKSVPLGNKPEKQETSAIN
jgi:hypothetical protein